MNTFKIFIAAMLLILATGCGSEDNTKTGSYSPDRTSLGGTWKSEANQGAFVKAVVKNRVITMTFDDETSQSLYWKGTFPMSSEDGVDLVSVADREALDSSLTGSQDKWKKFHYTDGTLTFSMSALGTTRKIELSKK